MQAGVHRVEQIYDTTPGSAGWVPLADIKRSQQDYARTLSATRQGDTHDRLGASDRSHALACVDRLEATMLQRIRHSIRDAGWLLRLRAGPRPISSGEWVATLAPHANSVHAQQDYVAYTAMKVTAVGPRAATVTVHDIDEETGWTHGGRQVSIQRAAVPLYRLATARSSARQVQVAGFLDLAGASSPYGLVGVGGQQMRRFTTRWARRQLQGRRGTATVIAPMQTTWTRRRMADRADPRPAVRQAQRSRWPQVAQKYWWRLAAGAEVQGPSRAHLTGNSGDRYCAWCRTAGRCTVDTTDHQLDHCPAWTKLREWVQSRTRQTGATAADYGDFILNGRTDTGKFGSGGLGVARGIALRVMCATLTKGRMTGPTYWPPANAAANATKLLAKEARLRHLAATKTGREAVAVFAKDWHGLVRTRRRTLDLLFG